MARSIATVAWTAALSLVGPAKAFMALTRDDGGPDDEVAQADLQYMGFDDSHGDDPVNPYFEIAWAWDDTVYSGANTGDACALFDLNGNGNADYSLCISIQTDSITGVVKQLGVFLYDCKDNLNLGCQYSGSTGGLIGEGVLQLMGDPDKNDVYDIPMKSFCTTKFVNDTFLDMQATRGSEQDPLLDTAAFCTLYINELKERNASPQPMGKAQLINVCTFPSPSPNSNAKDCVVTAGSGFIVVNKYFGGYTESPITPVFNFNLAGSISTSFTISGAGWSSSYPLQPGPLTITEGPINYAGVAFVEWICDFPTRVTSQTTSVVVNIEAGQRTVCRCVNWQGDLPPDYTQTIDTLFAPPPTLQPTNPTNTPTAAAITKSPTLPPTVVGSTAFPTNNLGVYVPPPPTLPPTVVGSTPFPTNAAGVYEPPAAPPTTTQSTTLVSSASHISLWIAPVVAVLNLM